MLIIVWWHTTIFASWTDNFIPVSRLSNKPAASQCQEIESISNIYIKQDDGSSRANADNDAYDDYALLVNSNFWLSTTNNEPYDMAFIRREDGTQTYTNMEYRMPENNMLYKREWQRNTWNTYLWYENTLTNDTFYRWSHGFLKWDVVRWVSNYPNRIAFEVPNNNINNNTVTFKLNYQYTISNWYIWNANNTTSYRSFPSTWNNHYAHKMLNLNQITTRVRKQSAISEYSVCKDYTLHRCGDGVKDHQEYDLWTFSDEECDGTDWVPSWYTCNSSCELEEDTTYYCWDWTINWTEQCEPPNNNNDNDCPQDELIWSSCQWNQVATRPDTLGDCNNSCMCELDPIVYTCVEGECGAECDSNDDCSESCNLNSCLCETTPIPDPSCEITVLVDGDDTNGPIYLSGDQYYYQGDPINNINVSWIITWAEIITSENFWANIILDQFGNDNWNINTWIQAQYRIVWTGLNWESFNCVDFINLDSCRDNQLQIDYEECEIIDTNVSRRLTNTDIPTTNNNSQTKQKPQNTKFDPSDPRGCDENCRLITPTCEIESDPTSTGLIGDLFQFSGISETRSRFTGFEYGNDAPRFNFLNSTLDPTNQFGFNDGIETIYNNEGVYVYTATVQNRFWERGVSYEHVNPNTVKPLWYCTGSIVISGSADLLIQKLQALSGEVFTSSNISVNPYDYLIYQINFTNTGDTTAENIQIYDLLPQGYHFIDARINITDWTPITDGTLNWQDRVLSNTFDLPANTSGMMIITGQIISGFENTYYEYRNLATFSGVSSNTVIAINTGDVFMSVIKEVTQTWAFSSWDEVGFNIIITNTWTARANDIIVEDIFPASLIYNGNWSSNNCGWEVLHNRFTDYSNPSFPQGFAIITMSNINVAPNSSCTITLTGTLFSNICDPALNRWNIDAFWMPEPIGFGAEFYCGPVPTLITWFNLSSLQTWHLIITGYIQNNYDINYYFNTGYLNFYNPSISIISNTVTAIRDNVITFDIDKNIIDSYGNIISTWSNIPYFLTGETIYFQIDITNNGDPMTEINIRDIRPDCVNYSDRWTDTTWVIETSPLNRTFNSLANWENLTIYLSGTISEDITCFGTHTNTGRVNSNMGSWYDETQFEIRYVDVIINKTADAESIEPGSLITFYLYYENNGTTPLENFILQDLWPRTMNVYVMPNDPTPFTPYTYIGPSSNTPSFSSGYYDTGLRLLEWNFPQSIQAWETGTIVITGIVN